MRKPSRLIPTIAATIVLTMNTRPSGYVNHWWWDNVCHFLSGLALGFVLPSGRERESYLTIAAVWELFEWWLATLKLYERFPMLPEGPRSLGYEGWSFDHQIEDTILDVILGYFGIVTARRIKEYDHA